ncbi:MAG: SEL1-like repeat protein [Deltaproteobacteria bacterium]|nr:SEL1-like repeat protein [Deltaproteobacteria bacterium]
MGSADAQYYIGIMYASGQSVELSYSQALLWYLRAADQNNSSEQNNLGSLYQNDHGISQDYAEAQYNLGLLYSAGLGVAPNEEQAYI